MRQAVIVQFTSQDAQEIDLHAHEAPLPADAARRWLDDQFLAHDCEPLRPTGKVLTADKVLVVAQAAGARLLGDAAWGGEFARATSAALAKPVVTVDLSTMSISF